MAIFNSYVKLPEGNLPPWHYRYFPWTATAPDGSRRLQARPQGGLTQLLTEAGDAMGKWPFMVDFPIKKWPFSIAMLVYQRVADAWWLVVALQFCQICQICFRRDRTILNGFVKQLITQGPPWNIHWYNMIPYQDYNMRYVYMNDNNEVKI